MNAIQIHTLKPSTTLPEHERSARRARARILPFPAPHAKPAPAPAPPTQFLTNPKLFGNSF